MEARTLPRRQYLIASAIGLIVATGFASAQTIAPPPSTPSNQAEIVELQNKVKQFEEVAAELSAARHALAQPHASFTDFANAAQQYRATPDDPQAKAKYAETFAVALNEMHQRHQRMLLLKEAVVDGFNAFEAVAAARTTTLEQQQAQSLETADEHKATATHWEGKLRDLAGQYATTIEQGEALPEDVDHLVERADILVSHAMTKEKLYRSFAARSEASIRRAKQSLDSARKWYRRADLHFLNASGHSEIITLLASIHRDELEGPLPNFADKAVELEPLDDPPILNDLMQALNTNELAPPEDELPEFEAPADQQKGRKILSRFLERSDS